MPLSLGHPYHLVFLCVFFLTFLFADFVYGQVEMSAEIPGSSTSGDEAAVFQDIPSVYGASKYEQKVTEAPSSITIITADEIKKYGYRTLADVLQSVNGFYVTNDRNYNYIGARGFSRPGDYNARVLLLVDGHRLNDNIYDQAAVGREEVIDLDLVEQIEIIRGPSSSLYGTNAFFGVVNIVTKRGRHIQGAEVSAETGSFDSRLGRLTYGNRFANGLEFLLSGSFYESHGHRRLFFREFHETNRGIAKNGDDDRFYKLFAKASIADFTFQGGYLSRKKALPTAVYDTVFNTTRTFANDEHAYVDLKYQHEFANQWNLLTRLYYDRYYYRGDYLYDYSDTEEPFLVFNRDISVGDMWGGEATLSKRLWERHKLTVGSEFRHNARQVLRNFDVDPFASYLDGSKNSKIWAFYLQDEFTLFQNLLLNVGVRYDHYDAFGGTFNPRVALIYNLPKTSIKLLYGEAFRAPTIAEQFYVTGETYKANPKLKPEEITTYEIVLEHYLSPQIRASLAGYYYTLDKLISQTTDPADNLLFFDNTESVDAKGLEVEIEGKWASGIQGRISYAVQDNESDKTDAILSNSPHHMGRINVILPVWPDKLFLGFEGRYLGRRRTLAGKTTSDHVVVNTTLFTQDFIRGLELTGSLYNLFDQRFGDPGSGDHRQDIIEQDGRTFWVKLKYAF